MDRIQAEHLHEAVRKTNGPMLSSTGKKRKRGIWMETLRGNAM